MANLRAYPSGFTVYRPSSHPRAPQPRGKVAGWSQRSTRNLIRWLYSVDPLAIADASVVSFTLTVQSSPPSPDHWKRLRESFFRVLHRYDIASLLWLTEWQRRGVPHLHGIVILPCSFPADRLKAIWLKCASDYGARLAGQDVKTIYDPLGWSEYLAKHSARGITNYQRHQANIPRGWKGKTGRIWGHRGPWPTAPPMEFALDDAAFFRLRRLSRSLAVSLARSRKDWKALRYARSMLKHRDPIVSRVRGLSRFAALDRTLELIRAAAPFGSIVQ